MKAPLKLAFLLLASAGFLPLAAQNTFPTPSGNVGIGTTTTPGTLLDIGPGTIPANVPSGASISALQVKTINGLVKDNLLSSFYAEQSVANNSSIEAAQLYTVSSHPSGNIARSIPIFVLHSHTGAGTVGDVRTIQTMGSMSGSGNVTNWYSFMGSIGNSGTGTITNAYGLYLAALSGNITHKYGVYVNDAAAINYFGGSIAIGTNNPQGYQLAVNGSAIFTKAIVKLFANWPDYVFSKEYVLPSLSSVELYVKTHHHLPDLPSAAEVEKSGVDLGNNQAALLKKIEELTLYTIQLQKQVDELRSQIKK